MPTTTDNLKEAFAGESQANRKYLAYGEQAAKDGFPGVAKLFRAVAAAETLHALAHLRAMGGVKGTVDNLTDAMAGEKHEFTEMYPPMVERAKAEGHKKAIRSMTWALEVEKVHYDLFDKAPVSSAESTAPSTRNWSWPSPAAPASWAPATC